MKNRVKVIEEYLTQHFCDKAQQVLTDEVNLLKKTEADNINRGGLIEQIKYLIGELGGDYVEGFAHALVSAAQMRREKEGKNEPPA